MKGRERYPRAAALLEKLAGSRHVDDAPVVPFAVGPAVLRPPPQVARAPVRERARKLDESLEGEGATEEMLGELVDMVFVSADDAKATGAQHGAAEVLGGLHMRLVKMPDGMHATFVVEDAAARRAVSDHVDGLVAHLKERGFSIASHRIELSSGGAGP